MAARVMYLPNLRMTLDHTAYKSYRPIHLTHFMLKSLERLENKYNNLQDNLDTDYLSIARGTRHFPAGESY